MFSPSRLLPDPGFPATLVFQDVDPDVLAREEATEAGRAARAGNGGWSAYLRRVLPALERNAAEDMAQALLANGTGAQACREHAQRMRRQSLAAGEAARARFWADVGEALVRVTRA